MVLNIRSNYWNIIPKKWEWNQAMDNWPLYLEYERLNERWEWLEELLMEDYTKEYLKKLEEIYFWSSDIQCLKEETRKEIERILEETWTRQCAILNSIMIQ